MKKILFPAVAMTIACASAMAQNELYHVFRSDNDFTTVKESDIKTITHKGDKTNGFTQLIFNLLDGSNTTIDISVVDSVQVRATGLPEFHVTLQDYPNWTELQGAKDDVHPATLYMDGNGMYDDLPEQTVEFRGRGNSTWNMKKKPYRFKMTKKAKVCGLPKAKTFALIANYIDCSLMRNAIALWTANYLEMPYSNHCVPVKVYMNGIYKGAYMLTEKIGIGGGSVDIDEYKGMLFELDSNYDEDFKFKYTWGGKVIPVMVKDPDLTEIVDFLNTTTAAYFQKWQNDFTAFANAVVSTPTTGSLKQYVDIESVVDYFIVNTLAGNHELQHPKSFYIHKDSIDGVYKFGPVWDFDWAFTFDGAEGASATVPLVAQNGDMSGYSFIKALMSNEEIRTLYKEKWDAFVKDGYPKLKAYMEEYANLIEPSAKENGLLWPADYSVSWRLSESSFDFRKNFEALKAWIDKRINYCNSHSNYGIYQ